MYLLYRYLIIMLMFAGLMLCLSFLTYIPYLYSEEGLPLFPSLLAAETALICIGLCGYSLYKLISKTILSIERHFVPVLEPWLANPAWAKGEVVYSAKAHALLFWFFPINWIGALWFFYDDRGDELVRQGIAIWILCIILVLVGVITVIVAFKKTFRAIRYRKSTLMIDTLPGRPGEYFKGRIKIPHRSRPETPFRIIVQGIEIRLEELEVDVDGETRKRSDMRECPPFFEEKQTLYPSRLERTEDQFCVPIKVRLPVDAPSSGKQSKDLEITWRLVIEDLTKGAPNYVATFDIPVFAKSRALLVLEQGGVLE